MLLELDVENLAVIAFAQISFESGMTVMTGETGAGKSILIDAMHLIMGERASKEIVRTGTDKARVNAVFGDLDEGLQSQLTEAGYAPEDGLLYLSREITADGKSTARMMGRPIPLTLLRTFTANLLNICGQHDSQKLLNAENHLEILDHYADDAALCEAYQNAYRKFRELRNEWNNLRAGEADRAQLAERLSYELDEISAVDPKPGEDDILRTRLQTMHGAEKLRRSLQKACELLNGVEGDGGCTDLLDDAISALAVTAKQYDEVRQLSDQIEGLRSEVFDVHQAMERLLSTVEFTPEELETAEQRAADLDELKRKYGQTLEQVLAYAKRIEEELSTIRVADHRRTALSEELAAQKKEVIRLGNELSQVRMAAGARFCEAMQQELLYLDMPNVQLLVSREKAKYGPHGCDKIEFLFSTNAGEAPRPLQKIASGGELSRIMLSLRNVLAARDRVPTLIFDEIDAGVSGSSSQKIGQKLRQVAKTSQVFCVTHSAQIAALSHHNFRIHKEIVDGRTQTMIEPLDYNGKIAEVARIMATDRVTDLMLQTAKAMVDDA